MDFASAAREWRPGLVRAAVLMGCPQSDAEDVVQTALMNAFHKWPSVEAADKPTAYVYRILVNAVRDQQRTLQRRQRSLARLPSISPHQSDLGDGLAVRAALGELSSEHREVLVLRYYSDLSEEDIARALRVPRGTVKSRSKRARAAMSRLLKEEPRYSS